jgi:hypothetical protein
MKTLFSAQLTAGANSWDAEHVFYDLRRPVYPVAVYFSPQARNYFPKEFTESFKRTMKLLLAAHRELQIVTPQTLSDFFGKC